MSEAHSIAIHTAQSDYYRFRTPYVGELFKQVGHFLALNTQSTVADLACGRGEVSRFLSAQVGRVHAIDGSSRMIALAHQAPNIHYQVTDLNAAVPAVEPGVEHLFFGRSIHWFNADSLRRISDAILLPQGKIVVCSTQWSPIGNWGPAYMGVVRQFAPPNSRRNIDFSGKSQLAGAGYSPVKSVTVHGQARVNSAFMAGHAFATTYDERLQVLKSHAAEFTHMLKSRLMPFENAGGIQMKITSWALIFDRTHA